MREAELHVLRARLKGGIGSKTTRGELRRGLPVRPVWAAEDGELLLHPDQAVRDVIGAPQHGRYADAVVRGVEATTPKLFGRTP